MPRITKYICFCTGFVFFVLLSFLSTLDVEAAIAVDQNPVYYPSANTLPPNYIANDPQCSNQCGSISIATTCWNSEAAGSTDCPDPSVRQPCSQNTSLYFQGVTATWTKFVFDSQAYCAKDSKRSDEFGTTCVAIYFKADNTYSTGDKYKESNPPVLDFGTCQGNVGSPYKTCCSGTTPVSANAFAVDPYDPLEGGCGNNTTVTCQHPTCISGTTCVDPNVQCGQAACAQLGTPPPTCQGTPLTCTSPQCPSGYTMVKLASGNYACYNNSTGTLCETAPYCPSACPTTNGWTGQQCSGPSSPNIAQTCATDSATCNKCSSAVCTLYDPSTNLYCYYNNTSACYVDPTFCTGFGNCGTCKPGSAKIDCSAPNVCSVP